MSQVKLGHYVSRTMTKPWEAADRHLHFFDLETGKMSREPSLTLFAKEGLHTTETERRLQGLIEDSVGKYKQRCAKAGRLVNAGEVDAREVRGLIGLLAFQSARSHQALSTAPPKYTVDEILSQDGAFDFLVDQFSRDFVLIGGTIPRGEWMVYPSLGVFMIPVLGYPPAAAVPLAPNAFVTLWPRDAPIESGIEAMVRTPNHISTFSFLGGGLEHKLVIPAQIAERNDPEGVGRLVTELRELGRQLFNTIGKAARAIGLPAYEYPSSSSPSKR
jgi:hypothetical protein